MKSNENLIIMKSGKKYERRANKNKKKGITIAKGNLKSLLLSYRKEKNNNVKQECLCIMIVI